MTKNATMTNDRLTQTFRALCVAVPLAVATSSAPAATADKRPTGETFEQILERLGDGNRENLVIRAEHDSRTDARKHKRFYTDLQPLDGFAPYTPVPGLSGTVRVSGLYLHDGLIRDQWIEAFERLQPGVKVVISQKGTIASGTVDIETGPRISDRLRAASEYERATGERLFEIDWATGSYDVPGWSPGFVIFVHADNPIAHLTIEQLDGIFAGARTGGWKGTTWDPSVARGVSKNLRTWGDVGLTGEWKDQPIRIYGRPLKYNIQLGFERKVFDGGDVWNENTREYSHEMNPDGTRYTSSVEMVKDMAADRYGIVFSDMGSNRPGIRTVPLGATADGPFVPISLATLRDRSYPLFIEQWAQVRLAPGQSLPPLVKAFLTFMLSRDGQDAVQRDGKWITLPAERAKTMLAKLEQKGERVDPKALGLHLDMLAPKKWDGESPDETGKVDPARAYYTKRFDLADLPAYTPVAGLEGTLRMPASGQLMQGTAGRALVAAFGKHQPGLRVELADGDLTAGQVDVSIGRRWSLYFAGEVFDFQQKHERSPREVELATGSFDVSGWNPAFAIVVGRDNPVKGLTIRQLDGIFGGPRRGGWVSTTWRREAGRDASVNLRRWRDVGVTTGPCADRPIIVFTPPLKYHPMSVFERKVLVGGNMWNDGVREIPLTLDADGDRSVPSADRVSAVAHDGCGITFASAGFVDARTRLVPIARDAESPYVLPTLDSVRDRSYPLHLEVYGYADAQPGKGLDAKAKAFLSFVLSREGQSIIARDGKWLPLTKPVLEAQRAKLERKD
ncbi:PstS family phosphate ABC transporter substrate-binding protein [Dokdonella sp. MW10]|uniref:PstS family phosphate ABC transporter substrate-binding protein n=1 Tax=Dokdonella sp. MW10 TaxID=2992926 RepID=UPI003F7E1C24